MNFILLIGLVYCNLFQDWWQEAKEAEQRFFEFWGIAPRPTPTPQVQRSVIVLDQFGRIRTIIPVATTPRSEPTLRIVSQDQPRPQIAQQRVESQPIPRNDPVPVSQPIVPGSVGPVSETIPEPIAEPISPIQPVGGVLEPTAVVTAPASVPTSNLTPPTTSPQQPNYTILVFVGIMGTLIIAASVFGYRSFDKKRVSFHPSTRMPDLEALPSPQGISPVYETSDAYRVLSYHSGYQMFQDDESTDSETSVDDPVAQSYQITPMQIAQPEPVLRQKVSLFSLAVPLGAQFRLSKLQEPIEDTESIATLESKASHSSIQSLETVSE